MFWVNIEIRHGDEHLYMDKIQRAAVPIRTIRVFFARSE